ncbi:MAG TPA: 50S ribosomal protein L29 [Patescibacteria group bacterium]|nr:50S ribosomal protein L29 [Patescibacteria group bacterium]
MKKKDLSEFKTKAISDLKKKIADLKKQNVENLLQIKMGKTKNVHEAVKGRKDIAKLETILMLKVLASEGGMEEVEKSKKEIVNAAG